MPFRERNAGIDADTVLFQHLRAFDTAVEQRAQQYAHNREHQAKNDTAENNQRFLRLQYPWLGDGRVDDTDIAHGAGLGDLQLLLFIQQLHINLLTRLHITRQTHNLLLGLRHGGHAVVQFGFLIL